MSPLKMLRVYALVALAVALPGASAGQTCTYEFSQSGGLGPYGHPVRVTVTRNLPTCSWSVAVVNSGQGWIGQVFRPDEGEGFFEVAAPPLSEPRSREITVLFRGDVDFQRLLYFTQAGRYYPCSYGAYATPQPRILPAGAASFTLHVQTYSTFVGYQCGWSAVSDDPWVAIANGTGLGNGSFDVVVAPNTGAYPRRVAIRVGAQGETAAFDIMQLGMRTMRSAEIGGSLGADAILYNSSTGRYDVLSMGIDGAGQSVRSRVEWGTFEANRRLATGDFNGDELTDVLLFTPDTDWCGVRLARSSSYTVLEPWACGVPSLPGGFPTILDANGDGRSDVLFYNPDSGAWMLNVAAETGNAFVEGPRGLWGSGWQVFVARFNDDRRDDLFLYNADPRHPYAGMWFRVLVRDDLSFDYFPGPALWSPGWTVVPGDFDGDGYTELFLHGYGNLGYWYIVDFRGGDVVYFGGRWAPGWQVYPADFNGDDRIDLFLYQGGPGPLAGYWVRALSNEVFDFDLLPGDMRWAEGMRVSIGDLDADGLSDVLIDGHPDRIAAQVLTRDAGHGSLYVYEPLWPVADMLWLSRTIVP
jgi:hypothetical protein